MHIRNCSNIPGGLEFLKKICFFGCFDFFGLFEGGSRDIVIHL